MRIKAFSAACLVAGSMLALGQPSAVQAQGTSKGKITIAGDIGFRAYTKEPDSLAKGKFEEYRDMRAGQSIPGPTPVIEQLMLKYTPADSFGVYNFGVRKLFDRDQSIWLQAKRPGQYDFQVRWDRIPHIYSTTARNPGSINDLGWNLLPIPRPDSNAWRNAPYMSAVSSQWDPMKVSLGLTPNEKTDFRVDYLRIAKTGGIPTSMSFSGSSGPQREFVAPIDQTMHDFRVSHGYVSGERKDNAPLAFIKSYQVQLSYDYSLFQNARKFTMVDNPQLSTSSFTNGTASGLASLAPDNAAQNLTVTGAVMLPVRTRVNGTVSEAWMQQNDPFLPQAANDSLKRDPNYSKLALPRTSLDGKVRTTVLNFWATSHPMNKLTVAAKLRRFQRYDLTPDFKLKAMAISDRSIALGDSLSREQDPFTKSNADISANYMLARGVSVTAGYSTENWTRNTKVNAGEAEDSLRNRTKTNEKSPRISLDYNGIEWLSLHASYSTGKRRGSDYIQAGTEIVDFRRFDLSDRDRKRTNILASVTPIDQLNVSVNYAVNDDKFPGSVYGTTRDKSTAKGFDIDWNPMARLSASVGYSREDADNVLESRYRTGRDTVGSPTWNNPTFNWVNTNTDKNTTTYVSVNAVLIPNKLDLMASMSNIDAHFWVYNVNPQTPTALPGGTAAQTLAATVDNWPEVTQNLKPFALSLRYRYSADWAVTLRYQGEKYAQNDFRTLAPVFTNTGLASGTPLTTNLTGDLPGTIGQVSGSNTGQYHFLGNNFHPYTANWFTLMVSYNPQSLPFGKARSTF